MNVYAVPMVILFVVYSYCLLNYKSHGSSFDAVVANDPVCIKEGDNYKCRGTRFIIDGGTSMSAKVNSSHIELKKGMAVRIYNSSCDGFNVADDSETFYDNVNMVVLVLSICMMIGLFVMAPK
jgi:hypothetical protein